MILEIVKELLDIINGKEITPNLNKFLEENIEFSNMFMQSYSSTADSEFSTISSLYPMENGMSYSKYNSKISGRWGHTILSEDERWEHKNKEGGKANLKLAR